MLSIFTTSSTKGLYHDSWLYWSCFSSFAVYRHLHSADFSSFLLFRFIHNIYAVCTSLHRVQPPRRHVGLLAVAWVKDNKHLVLFMNKMHQMWDCKGVNCAEWCGDYACSVSWFSLRKDTFHALLGAQMPNLLVSFKMKFQLVATALERLDWRIRVDFRVDVDSTLNI